MTPDELSRACASWSDEYLAEQVALGSASFASEEHWRVLDQELRSRGVAGALEEAQVRIEAREAAAVKLEQQFALRAVRRVGAVLLVAAVGYLQVTLGPGRVRALWVSLGALAVGGLAWWALSRRSR